MEVGLDYKTVRYHLRVLVENDILVASHERYGTLYFWSATMMDSRQGWREIWESVEKGLMPRAREAGEHDNHVG